MRKLLVSLDDYCDKELAKYPNQSETLRESFRIYNGNISTDTLSGMRQSYKDLRSFMDSKFQYYDSVFAQLEKLISVLETRM